tara:strand:+ start:57 stop:251 length:195 start_codon:yes stop_codon:yes gene_type:complete
MVIQHQEIELRFQRNLIQLQLVVVEQKPLLLLKPEVVEIQVFQQLHQQEEEELEVIVILNQPLV